MQPNKVVVGEIVIHNDIIGVVTELFDNRCKVRTANNRFFTFLQSECTDVIKPAALAKMYKEKLIERTG